ncbi:hypothetical protein [Alienimonas sp. DA493]|uniref:hypothetical protein n=1 Tax=Alienimonas sp. DA493 TaxID=3373605 RepID=UPI003754C937
MRRVLSVAVLLTWFATPDPAAGQLTELFARGAEAVRRQATRAGAAGADAATVTRTVNVQDVDLATLKERLARFGVYVPIEAEGTVSASLTVTARLAQITQSGAITATGRITSPRLTLAPAPGAFQADPVAAPPPAEPLVLTDVVADLSLARGVLALNDLTVNLPADGVAVGGPVGTLTGSASLPLAGEETEATATLTATDVPLALLWERLGEGLPVAGGTFTGTVTAAVPWPERGDPTAYEATAQVAATGLTVAGRAVNDLNAALALADGTAELERLSVLVAGQPLRGAASAGIVAPYPFEAAVTSDRFDLAAVEALFPDGRPAWLPEKLSGTLALDVQADGTLEPSAGTLAASLRGGAALPPAGADGEGAEGEAGEPLRINGLAITEVRADLAAAFSPDPENEPDPGNEPEPGLVPDLGDAEEATIAVRNLLVRTEAGAVTGSATADLAGPGAWTVELAAADLSPRLLEALPESVRPPDEAIGGDGTLSARGTAAGTLEPRTVAAADLTFDGENLTVLGTPLSEVTARLSVANETLVLENLALELPVDGRLGRLTGSAALPLTEEAQTEAAVDLAATDVPLSLLWDYLGDDLPVSGGTLTGTVTGRVPWPQRDDLAAYEATAEIAATGLTVAGRALDDLDAALALDDGVAELDRFNALIAGQPLRGAGELGVVAPHPFEATATSERFDLALLTALFPDEPPHWLPANVAGTAALDAQAEGTLEPAAVSLAATLRGGSALQPDGDPLSVNGLAVTTLSADLAVAYSPERGNDGEADPGNDGDAVDEDGPDAIKLTNVVLRTEAGSVVGSATADLTGAGAWTTELTATDLAPRLLEALPEPIRPPAGALAGEGSLTLAGTLAGTLEPRALTAAELTLSGDNLRVYDVPVFDVAGNLSVANGEAALTDVRAVTDRGTFTGGAAVGPDGWTAEGRLGEVTAAAFDLIPECVRPPEWLVARQGRFAAAGRARGPANPWGLEQVRADVRGTGLRLFSLPVETLSADLRLADDRLTAAEVNVAFEGAGAGEGEGEEGEAPGGSLTGIAAVDFDRPDLPLTAELTLSNLDLTRLPADLLPPEYGLNGVAAGNGRIDVRFPPPPDPDATDPNDPCVPRRGFRVAAADGSVTLRKPTLALPGGGRIALREASTKFGVANDSFQWRDLLLVPVPPNGSQTARGRLTGEGAVGLSAPRPFRATLRWDEWPTDALLPPLLGALGFPAPEEPAAAEAPLAGARRGSTLGQIAATGTLEPLHLETAEGVLRASDVRLPRLAPGLALPSLAAEVALTPERLTVNSFKARFLAPPDPVSGSNPPDAEPRVGTLTASGSRSRREPHPFKLKFDADDLPLAVAAPGLAAAGVLGEEGGSGAAAGGPLAGLPTGPEAFAGTVTLGADLSGSDDPADLRGTLSLSGEEVTAFGVGIDLLTLAAEADENVIRVNRLGVALGQAAASGRAELRTDGARPWAAAANVTGADPRDLARRLAPVLPLAVRELGPDSPDSPVALGGALNFSLTADGRLGDPAAPEGSPEAAAPWNVDADLTSERFALEVPPDEDFPGLGPVVLTDVTTDLSVAHPARGGTRLTVERLAAKLADGDLRVTASVPLPRDEPAAEPSVGSPAPPVEQDKVEPEKNGTATLAWVGGDVGALLTAASPPRFDPAAGGTEPALTGAATVRIASAWPAGRLSLKTVALNGRVTSDLLTVVRRSGAGRPVRLRDAILTAELAGGVGKGGLEARGLGGDLGAAAAFRPLPPAVEPTPRLAVAPAPVTPAGALDPAAVPAVVTDPIAGESVAVRPAAADSNDFGFGSWPLRVVASAGVRNGDLLELESVLRGRSGAAPSLRGQADLCLRFDSHPEGPPVDLAALLPGVAPPPGCAALPTLPPAEVESLRSGPPPRLTGTVRLRQVTWGGKQLVNDAALAIDARDPTDWTGELRNGRYAGGTFQLTVGPPPGGDSLNGAVRIELLLRDAEAARAFAPVPWLGENVTGRLGARLNGVLGVHSISLRGQVELDRGRFLAAEAPGRPGNEYLFDVSRWRLPTELVYTPAAGSGRVRIGGASATLGGGSVEGAAVVDFGRSPGVGLDVDLDLRGVDSNVFTRGAGGNLTGGRVAGSVTLAGRAVDGLEDLEGEARLILLNPSPQGLPVLSALQPFLKFRGPATARTGELAVRLRNSIARIEKLTLSGPGIRLFASGTAALPAGRLDLEVVADTGPRNVTEDVLLRLIEESAGPTPVGFALRAARLLRDRVVYLHVGGTVRRPRVQVQTGRQVREEAIRFLLGELFVPGGGPGAAAPGG